MSLFHDEGPLTTKSLDQQHSSIKNAEKLDYIEQIEMESESVVFVKEFVDKVMENLKPKSAETKETNMKNGTEMFPNTPDDGKKLLMEVQETLDAETDSKELEISNEVNSNSDESQSKSMIVAQLETDIPIESPEDITHERDTVTFVQNLLYELLDNVVDNNATCKRYLDKKEEIPSKRAKHEETSSAEKSVPIDGLVANILRHPMTAQWERSAMQPYTLHVVPNNSNEFKTVEKLFLLTSRGTQIKTLERVQNPYLLGQYLLKKDKMCRGCKTVEEKRLFHGTREDSVSNICKSNFDWRRNGSSRGHKFGQGVSFTPEVSYAKHYTPDNIMFLVKVLTSNVTEGSSTTVVPPDNYDTTRNWASTVFVKYEDNDFFPEYVIHY